MFWAVHTFTPIILNLSIGKPNMAQLTSIASFLNWKEHESHCGGQHQSPINIESKDAIIANYPEFNFHNYDLVFPERLENNGYTGKEY
jgi:carbonic anhydrase